MSFVSVAARRYRRLPSNRRRASDAQNLRKGPSRWRVAAQTQGNSPHIRVAVKREALPPRCRVTANLFPRMLCGTIQAKRPFSSTPAFLHRDSSSFPPTIILILINLTGRCHGEERKTRKVVPLISHREAPAIISGRIKGGARRESVRRLCGGPECPGLHHPLSCFSRLRAWGPDPFDCCKGSKAASLWA